MPRRSNNSRLKMQVNQEVKRINRGLKIKRVMEESSIASEDLIIEDLFKS
jgi:hypothetical protein